MTNELVRNSRLALKEAASVLGSGVSVTCGDAHAGFGWYAFYTKRPELGSVKLEAPPLPLWARTQFSSKLDPSKRLVLA